jgi:lipoic acid synthetase
MVFRLGLKHTVLTSVTRDDIDDGGARHIADTIRAIKARMPDTTLEVLVPDFDGNVEHLQTVVDAGAEVFSHNIETVRRLFPRMRDQRFSYDQSLASIATVARISSDVIVKSGFMVGCGESPEEVSATLDDLLEAGCEAVSIGQYLQPTPKHHEVQQFIPPEEFESYEALAYAKGFAFAVAGPFVRSSYRAEALLTAPGILNRRKLVGKKEGI